MLEGFKSFFRPVQNSTINISLPSGFVTQPGKFGKVANKFRNYLIKVMKIKILLFVLSLGLLSVSCFKHINQAEVDDKIIQAYLTANKLTAVKDASGLYYMKTAEGTGVAPTATSTVEVKYKGSLPNGYVFDQTPADSTFTNELSELILGWQIGLPLMKEGGKATLFIPSALGYGSMYVGPIPPNSVLIFDIELIDVK
jgi:FKBP-type peptidyl-prolyl cis-trans isomerase FkpA